MQRNLAAKEKSWNVNTGRFCFILFRHSLKWFFYVGAFHVACIFSKCHRRIENSTETDILKYFVFYTLPLQALSQHLVFVSKRGLVATWCDLSMGLCLFIHGTLYSGSSHIFVNTKQKIYSKNSKSLI